MNGNYASGQKTVSKTWDAEVMRSLLLLCSLANMKLCAKEHNHSAVQLPELIQINDAQIHCGPFTTRSTESIHAYRVKTDSML